MRDCVKWIGIREGNHIFQFLLSKHVKLFARCNAKEIGNINMTVIKVKKNNSPPKLTVIHIVVTSSEVYCVN